MTASGYRRRQRRKGTRRYRDWGLARQVRFGPVRWFRVPATHRGET